MVSYNYHEYTQPLYNLLQSVSFHSSSKGHIAETKRLIWQHLGKWYINEAVILPVLVYYCNVNYNCKKVLLKTGRQIATDSSSGASKSRRSTPQILYSVDTAHIIINSRNCLLLLCKNYHKFISLVMEQLLCDLGRQRNALNWYDKT
jgi:hypothetical protein